jgi:hypothetical protein
MLSLGTSFRTHCGKVLEFRIAPEKAAFVAVGGDFLQPK